MTVSSQWATPPLRQSAVCQRRSGSTHITAGRFTRRFLRCCEMCRPLRRTKQQLLQFASTAALYVRISNASSAFKGFSVAERIRPQCLERCCELLQLFAPAAPVQSDVSEANRGGTFQSCSFASTFKRALILHVRAELLSVALDQVWCVSKLSLGFEQWCSLGACQLTGLRNRSNPSFIVQEEAFRCIVGMKEAPFSLSQASVALMIYFKVK